MTLEHTSFEPEYPSLGPESGFPVMVDPVVEHVFQLAKEYQKELDYTPSPSSERLEEIVEDLDNHWPYSGSMIGVSGLVTSAIIEQVDPVDSEDSDTLERPTQVVRVAPIMKNEKEPFLKEYYVNDMGYQSLGFSFDTEPWPELVGGQNIGDRAVLKLMFRRYVNVHLDDGSEAQCQLITNATIDKVSLEMPHISPQMAELWSRESFASEVAEIDERLAGATTHAEQLLALRYMKIDCHDYTTWQDKAALEQYVDDAVGLEREGMPFVARLRRGTPLFGVGEDQMQIMDFLSEEKQFILDVQGLRIYAACHSKLKKSGKLKAEFDPNEFEIRLGVQIIGQEARKDTPYLEIRLSDIKTVQNIREMLTEDF